MKKAKKTLVREDVATLACKFDKIAIHLMKVHDGNATVGKKRLTRKDVTVLKIRLGLVRYALGIPKDGF